jgi:hypothetical protein
MDSAVLAEKEKHMLPDLAQFIITILELLIAVVQQLA